MVRACIPGINTEQKQASMESGAALTSVGTEGDHIFFFVNNLSIPIWKTKKKEGSAYDVRVAI